MSRDYKVTNLESIFKYDSMAGSIILRYRPRYNSAKLKIIFLVSQQIYM